MRPSSGVPHGAPEDDAHMSQKQHTLLSKATGGPPLHISSGIGGSALPLDHAIDSSSSAAATTLDGRPMSSREAAAAARDAAALRHAQTPKHSNTKYGGGASRSTRPDSRGLPGGERAYQYSSSGSMPPQRTAAYSQGHPPPSSSSTGYPSDSYGRVKGGYHDIGSQRYRRGEESRYISSRSERGDTYSSYDSSPSQLSSSGRDLRGGAPASSYYHPKSTSFGSSAATGPSSSSHHHTGQSSSISYGSGGPPPPNDNNSKSYYEYRDNLGGTNRTSMMTQSGYGGSQRHRQEAISDSTSPHRGRTYSSGGMKSSYDAPPPPSQRHRRQPSSYEATSNTSRHYDPPPPISSINSRSWGAPGGNHSFDRGDVIVRDHRDHHPSQQVSSGSTTRRIISPRQETQSHFDSYNSGGIGPKRSFSQDRGGSTTAMSYGSSGRSSISPSRRFSPAEERFRHTTSSTREDINTGVPLPQSSSHLSSRTVSTSFEAPKGNNMSSTGAVVSTHIKQQSTSSTSMHHMTRHEQNPGSSSRQQHHHHEDHHQDVNHHSTSSRKQEANSPPTIQSAPSDNSWTQLKNVASVEEPVYNSSGSQRKLEGSSSNNSDDQHRTRTTPQPSAPASDVQATSSRNSPHNPSDGDRNNQHQSQNNNQDSSHRYNNNNNNTVTDGHDERDLVNTSSLDSLSDVASIQEPLATNSAMKQQQQSNTNKNMEDTASSNLGQTKRRLPQDDQEDEGTQKKPKIDTSTTSVEGSNNNINTSGANNSSFNNTGSNKTEEQNERPKSAQSHGTTGDSTNGSSSTNNVPLRSMVEQMTSWDLPNNDSFIGRELTREASQGLLPSFSFNSAKYDIHESFSLGGITTTNNDPPTVVVKSNNNNNNSSNVDNNTTNSNRQFVTTTAAATSSLSPQAPSAQAVAAPSIRSTGSLTQSAPYQGTLREARNPSFDGVLQQSFTNNSLGGDNNNSRVLVSTGSRGGPPPPVPSSSSYGASSRLHGVSGGPHSPARARTILKPPSTHSSSHGIGIGPSSSFQSFSQGGGGGVVHHHNLAGRSTSPWQPLTTTGSNLMTSQQQQQYNSSNYNSIAYNSSHDSYGGNGNSNNLRSSGVGGGTNSSSRYAYETSFSRGASPPTTSSVLNHHRYDDRQQRTSPPLTHSHHEEQPLLHPGFQPPRHEYHTSSKPPPTVYITPSSLRGVGGGGSGIGRTSSYDPSMIPVNGIHFHHHPGHHHMSGNPFGWTTDDDQRLSDIMKKYKNPSDWDIVSKEHNRGKSAKQCHERWIRYLKPGVRKGQWQDHEDAIVIEAVTTSEEQPFTRWSELAQRLPGRVGKQIRDRWVNHLNPAINHMPFTREDDLLLFKGHQELGKRWVEISSKFFNGSRSENHIKNRWYSASFKKFITNEFGPDAYGKRGGIGLSSLSNTESKDEREESDQNTNNNHDTTSSSGSGLEGEKNNKEKSSSPVPN